MYPPVVTTITIDVYACDYIYECAENTFTITVYDTDPTLNALIFDSYEIIQYDAAANIGQFFTFSETATVFADADQVSDSANDFYNH